MKTISTYAALLAGMVALSLWATGCGSHNATPSSSLSAGAAPVDSNKPPPEMQALYQRTQAARAGAAPPAGGPASP